VNAKPIIRNLYPLLALTALCLVVAPSILTPGKLLCTAVDGRHFLVRLHELSWLAERGVIWPRWGPNLGYGYGYPVFHYYGSLSLYPSLLLHHLGAPLVSALQGGFWLALVLSAWAAYAWLRAVTQDERAALVGAAAYAFIPYHLNTVLYRLNLPEPWGMVWGPLALWGLHCVAHQGTWRAVGWTALALAALPLTSNLAALVFAPVVASYAPFLWLLGAERRALLGRLAACAGLALGLAAFFLVPAFVDRNLVQIERGYTPGGLNVFTHFIALRRVFWQPLSADISRANPLYDPLSLGLVVPAAALAVLALRWKEMERPLRAHAAWAAAAAAGCIALATAVSAPLYRALPALQMLQFPWRFLAPASLLVALLAGLAARAGLEALPARWGRACVPVLTAVLALLGGPLLYPGLFCERAPDPTLGQAVAAQVGMVGSLSTTAEYVPRTVDEIPERSPMFEDYVQGRPVVRWDRSRLPEGGRTLSISDAGPWAEWEIETPRPFAALYQAFMFPGWQAAIDGRPVEIRAAPPYGLIEFDVPAGRHQLMVRFGSTPERTLSTIVSCVALLAVAVLLVAGGGHPARRRSPGIGSRLPGICRSPASIGRIPASIGRPAHLRPSTWLWVGALGVALLVLRLALVDPLDLWPRARRFDGQAVRGVEQPLAVTYSGGQWLLGYDMLSRPTSAGAPLEVDLYWATTSGVDFRALIRLVDDAGQAWTGWNQIVDFVGLVGPPDPWRWGPEHYTSERYHLDVPPGTPPGTYSLSVAVVRPDTPAPFYVEQGQPLNAERTEAVVGTVRVERRPVPAAALDELAAPGRPLAVDGALTLVRCDVSADRATVGERVTLRPLWHAAAPPDVNAYTLRLVDPGGTIAVGEQHSLCDRYSPAAWQANELVRGQVSVLLPAHLAAGQYNWTIDIDGREMPLGALEVLVPERRFEVPDEAAPRELGSANAAARTLDGVAELAGWRLPDASQVVPGAPLAVTLYWRARAETSTSYKVFVHLIGPQGLPVAQSDAVPAAWTRPTTGWLPPEVIEDAHTLALPGELLAGRYRLVVGMYEPGTGRRAVNGGGEDHIVIGAWEQR
jgi:hypothetical protein